MEKRAVVSEDTPSVVSGRKSTGVDHRGDPVAGRKEAGVKGFTPFARYSGTSSKPDTGKGRP